MFEFDAFNRPELVRIFLCKPDDTIVCELNGIVEDTAQMKVTLNNQAELTFDYDRYVVDDNGSKIESNGYHSLNVDMQLLVTGLGFFRMKYPPMTWSASGETKSITAYSCECELEDKDLVAFNVNTGASDSLEYLITYDDDETEEVLNAYTGLPYDYIVFNNTYPEQLSELLNKYEDGSTITDAESIEEIKSYCSLIPRLMRRTYAETDASGQTSTSLTEYVEYTYEIIADNEGVLSTSDTVVSIYLFDGFNARISELITFYTKYHDQLSLIPLAIENCSCNWSVGTIDSSLSNKKYQFTVDGENIYSFLTSDVAGTCNCVFQFDLYNRVINVTLVENIGVDSGLIIDKENLLNSLEVSCSTDSIVTRYRVSGGNDIDILLVNFASYRIEDLMFFIYARDEDGNRIYMSDTLAEKYLQYVEDREIARGYYIDYTKTYNQLLTDIDEIQYRVPNDSLQEDYSTYTYTELENLLTVYNNLLATLQTLYKEDYGSAGCNSDGSINEDYLKNTEYWYDYYAYVYTLEQIHAAMDAITDDSSYAEIDDEAILAVINAYETEWSLYGIVELQAKIEAYTNSMNVLTDAESVVLDSDGAPIPWDELTESQQTEYGSLDVNYHYSEYKELYDNKAAAQAYLEELQSELAVMEEALAEAQANRNAVRDLVTLAGYDRAALAQIIDLNDPSEATFTTEEIQTITRLYKDNTYTNENILTTSLDTTVTTVDVEYELLQDAQEQLSIYSQPQISFSAELDNLMAMPEFKNFQFEVGNYVTVRYYDDYYVTLRLYSITYNPCIPESELSVTFTNYLNSKSERSDLSYILDQAGAGSSSSSSGSSGGSDSSFGTSDDIDVTISNTMLAKLLNTEMFGSRVSNIILDTLKLNTLTAKYATFDGLARGMTVIDGRCIQTGVLIAGNYNGTINTDSYGASSYAFDNTEGSIIDLESGSFSMAGGQLLYDADSNTLTFGEDVKLTWNSITTDTEDQTLEDYINSAISSAGSGNYLTYDVATTLLSFGGTELTSYYVTAPNLVGGSLFIGDKDGINFSVDTEGNMYCNSAEIVGKVTATSGYIGSTSSGWVITSNAIYNGTTSTTDNVNGGTYIGTDGIRQFNASNGRYITLINGTLSANNASISGTLTAGANSQIGPWYVTASAIYNTKSALDSTSNGVYIGTDGIGLGGSASGTLFKVTSGGVLTAQSATITGTVYADSGTIGKWSISDDYDGTNTGICYLGSTYRVYLCQGLNSTKDVLVCRDVSGTYTTGEYYPLVLQATGSITCSNITVTGLPESGGTYTLANGLGRYASIIKVNYLQPYSDNSITLLSKTYSSTTATYGSVTIGDPTYYCQLGVWAKYITMASSAVTTGSYYGVYAIGTESYSCYCTITGTCQVVGSFIQPTDSSDERLKTDWISVDKYDQFFDLLQPKGFKYLYGSSNLTDRYHLGFGAQTIKAALEECGLTEDDFGGLNTHEVPEGTSGYHGYDEEYSLIYTEFIALLVDQVQKLKTRVSSLEQQLASAS